MALFTPSVRRTDAASEARIRSLQADLREAHQQQVALAARLRAETQRADNAEREHSAFRAGIRSSHQQLLAYLRRMQGENRLLRLDREHALRELDRLTALDAKTLATANGASA